MRSVFRVWVSLALLSSVIVAACHDDSPTAPVVDQPSLMTTPGAVTLIDADFDADAGGFVYTDDAFRSTTAPQYASGTHATTGGIVGGGLSVVVGGIDNATVLGMSGGWERDFTLAAAANVSVTLRYNLTQNSDYESDEFSQALLSIDGTLRGAGTGDALAQMTGNGNGGGAQTTGWVQVTISLGMLGAGTHTLALGAYNNKKTFNNEASTVLIDDVHVEAVEPIPGAFTYTDDLFRGTSAPGYASGTQLPDGSFSLTLGGIDNATILGMSGGWTRTVTLSEPLAVSVTLQYQLTQNADYESDEFSQVLLGFGGALHGLGGNDFLAQLVGNGNGGGVQTTGLVTVTVPLGVHGAGDHILAIGGYNNKKTFNNEATTVLIDAVIVETDAPPVNEFTYVDDAFRGTSAPAYASGAQLGDGSLQVTLGGIDDDDIVGMSGGWRRSFEVTEAGPAILSLRYRMTMAANYESNELSQVLVTVDGVLRGLGGADYVVQLTGDGNGGGDQTTGTVTAEIPLGTLNTGTHTLTVGGYNNQKTLADESTVIVIEDATVGAPPDLSDIHTLVGQLDFQRFQDNIETLAAFGDRTQGSPSNVAALDWIQQQLESYGYVVERHPYTFNGEPRENIYATKVGAISPDSMYIVSAHMDGRGGGGGADDDASGTSLVLEAARVLGQPGVETEHSVRFILWNNEETGLNGSAAYVSDRAALQGQESAPGSGIFPEPAWLGIIQHDMILFDHGLPVQPNQIPGADVDVEYQASATFAAAGQALALRLANGNVNYSTDYPAEVGSNMRNTDSYSFRNFTAAVSVRENQRVAEIGNGSNPHWHQPTDVFSTYSLADFRLGFNALQMTLGTVAELAGASLVP